jgi:excisionase family DNA binding protein
VAAVSDRLLKVAEVAKRLRTDPSTVRKKIRAGALVATKPCGHHLVAESEVERFLERSRVVPQTTTSKPRAPRPEATMPAPPTGRPARGSFRARRRETA